jgi:hypothetical protein
MERGKREGGGMERGEMEGERRGREWDESD